MKSFKIKNILIIILALVLCMNSPIFALDGEENNDDYTFNITELNVEESYREDIPLLIILINYDANGNGVDDFDPSDPTKLTTKGTPYYGEQWLTSNHDAWAERGFGEQSVQSYYNELTEGNFKFTPCPETCAPEDKNGKINDGIVEVTVHSMHPYAKIGNQKNEDVTSRQAAIKAAAEYVDFASLDKNDDKKLSWTELAIIFVCAGSEYSSNYKSNRHFFQVHAHYTGGSGVKINGVTVGNSGFVRAGEYVSSSKILTVGVMTHELGHFLGAPDLYDTGGGNWNYAGYMTLMASGSWSGDQGQGAAYMDPYNLIDLNLYSYQTVTEDGEYSLYNRQADQPYNIIKLCTTNPKEYYLIENRYSSPDETKFDRIDTMNRGLVVWHIDESINEAGKPNSTSSSGEALHDPGIAVMGPKSISPNVCGFRKIGDTFEANSSKYKFPVSGTCFTKLTGEAADNFNLKITVISEMGNEIKVKLENVCAVPPSGLLTTRDITETTATIVGKISNLNNGNCTSAGFIISKTEDLSPDNKDAIVVPCIPDSEGAFSYTLTGLTASTKYYYKMYLTGKYGTNEIVRNFYTASPKKPRTDYYVVYMYKGLKDPERAFEVKIKPGATLSYKFPMEKRGYVFCGWFYDPELTQAYNMGFTQTECIDFSLYAKWIEPENVARLQLVGATSKYELFPCEIGTSFVYVTPNEIDGYVFDGWYIDENFSAIFDFDEIITEEVTTIYAKWTSLNPPSTEETTTVETTTEATTVETTTEATAVETTTETTTIIETTIEETIIVTETEQTTNTETTTETQKIVESVETITTNDNGNSQPSNPGIKPVVIVIIAGSIVGVIVLALVIFYFVKKKKQNQSNEDNKNE